MVMVSGLLVKKLPVNGLRSHFKPSSVCHPEILRKARHPETVNFGHAPFTFIYSCPF